MQIVRTIVWVLLLVALLLFSAFNWKPVEVKIWEGLILETKIPALVIVSFLIGLVPMWLLNRAQKFALNRRIGSLETAARTAATTPIATAPAPTPAPVDRPVSKDDVLAGRQTTPHAEETDEALKPEKP
jgi:putative membrane protein